MPAVAAMIAAAVGAAPAALPPRRPVTPTTSISPITRGARMATPAITTHCDQPVDPRADHVRIRDPGMTIKPEE
jgi:hypothetical protein